MKAIIILLSLVGLVCGQDRPECRCAAFVTVQEGELDVLNFPPIDLNDCTEETVCATACVKEWNQLTNGGDLHTLMPDDVSVGQHMCDRLAAVGHTNYNNRQVYLYYNLCNGPWIYDGETFVDNLCCTDGSYRDCPSLFTQ
ncbi:hypothetical protein Pmani_016680 [Petrolisthes manimaculis]|uniref:Uncharacterized protein n=1 Tax=Petrolisthes manimaculis TaxID=1843537 RepID=A0AAE1PR56_9EUCA|nr:hypothetical protein Pmani_016680 [Petrolisthes manimaculis]